jgi:hypothetical protein
MEAARSQPGFVPGFNYPSEAFASPNYRADTCSAWPMAAANATILART